MKIEVPRVRLDTPEGKTTEVEEPGAAAGSFLGHRWLVTGGLTGLYKTLYGLEIEPSARVYALWEHEDAYVDFVVAALNAVSAASRDVVVLRVISSPRDKALISSGRIVSD